MSRLSVFDWLILWDAAMLFIAAFVIFLAFYPQWREWVIDDYDREGIRRAEAVAARGTLTPDDA